MGEELIIKSHLPVNPLLLSTLNSVPENQLIWRLKYFLSSTIIGEIINIAETTQVGEIFCNDLGKIRVFLIRINNFNR
ncbi:hypothetical protein [Okeania sp. KiyG1]|uniref:hypothetical protein n=1 Tax=Okeania sp. KiyG1 TaxID=2720165 RepID=UPI001922DFD5|nr:hypothetical protein [Okeania sp. KiyG1]